MAESYNARFGGTEYLIVGAEDTLRYAEGVLSGSSSVIMDVPGQVTGDQITAWTAQDREFLAALRENRAPRSSGSDVPPHPAVLQQIENGLALVDRTE